MKKSFITSGPGPLINVVCYSMVLFITLIIAGPQMAILDYFCNMSIHFTLVTTWVGWLGPQQ